MILLPILFLNIVYAVPDPTRGVWFTISGTSSPFSKEGIDQVVGMCKFVGINTIYFSVWDKSMVNFIPSQTLLHKYPFLKINPKFSFDPLRYLT